MTVQWYEPSLALCLYFVRKLHAAYTFQRAHFFAPSFAPRVLRERFDELI